MKRIVFALLLFAGPALAQQATPPNQRALEIMLTREMAAHQTDLATAVELGNQVTTLTKQVGDLTKDLADTKKAPADAPAK